MMTVPVCKARSHCPMKPLLEANAVGAAVAIVAAISRAAANTKSILLTILSPPFPSLASSMTSSNNAVPTLCYAWKALALTL
jgi:hypothetical protein